MFPVKQVLCRPSEPHAPAGRDTQEPRPPPAFPSPPKGLPGRHSSKVVYPFFSRHTGAQEGSCVTAPQSSCSLSLSPCCWMVSREGRGGKTQWRLLPLLPQGQKICTHVGEGEPRSTGSFPCCGVLTYTLVFLKKMLPEEVRFPKFTKITLKKITLWHLLWQRKIINQPQRIRKKKARNSLSIVALVTLVSVRHICTGNFSERTKAPILVSLPMHRIRVEDMWNMGQQE